MPDKRSPALGVSKHTELTDVLPDQHGDTKVRTKEVDETGIADGYILEYMTDSGKLEYVPKPSPRTLTIYEARSTSTQRSTESTSYVDHPDFSITETFPTCKITVFAHLFGSRSVEHGRGTFELHVDGVSKGVSDVRSVVAGANAMANIIRHFSLPAGEHTIKVKWKVCDALGGTFITPGWADALGLSILVIE